MWWDQNSMFVFHMYIYVVDLFVSSRKGTFCVMMTCM